MKSQSRVVYEDLYTRIVHDENDRWACFYCGEPATTMDHQPPISRVDDYRAIGLRREVYVKVNCCKECNSLLGDHLTDTLIERELLAKRSLEKRYLNLVRQPEWTNKEIRRLAPRGGLREYIKNAQEAQERLFNRLDYSGGINSYIEKYEDDDYQEFVVTPSD